MRTLGPVAAGVYAGDHDTRGPERIVGNEAFTWLEEIRAARGPDGLFVGHLTPQAGAPTARG
jgi:hypothetical protein